jgi:hypothetical protein
MYIGRDGHRAHHVHVVLAQHCAVGLAGVFGGVCFLCFALVGSLFVVVTFYLPTVEKPRCRMNVIVKFILNYLN